MLIVFGEEGRLLAIGSDATDRFDDGATLLSPGLGLSEGVFVFEDVFCEGGFEFGFHREELSGSGNVLI